MESKDNRDENYTTLLDWLERIYEEDTERTNYAKIFLTMNEADSIRETISIYCCVYRKLAEYNYRNEEMPDDWFVSNKWTWLDKAVDDLRRCVNDNILRLYKNASSATPSLYYKCLVNLRNCSNLTNVERVLLNLAPETDKKYEKQCIGVRNASYSLREEMLYRNSESNGFKDRLEDYITIMKWLHRAGYETAIEEIEFERIKNIHYLTQKSFWLLLAAIVAFVVILLICNL